MKRKYISPNIITICSDTELAILAGSSILSGNVTPVTPGSGLGGGGTISGGGNGDNIGASKHNNYTVWNWDDEDFEDEENEKKKR